MKGTYDDSEAGEGTWEASAGRRSASPSVRG